MVPTIRLVGLLTAALLWLAPPGGHAEPGTTKTCADPATTGEQKQCAEDAYRKASEVLRATYARVMAAAAKADSENTPSTTEKSYSSLIADSQRAWENYRDAECWGLVGRGDGSARMAMVWGCLAEKSAERIRELNVPYDER